MVHVSCRHDLAVGRDQHARADLVEARDAVNAAAATPTMMSANRFLLISQREALPMQPLRLPPRNFRLKAKTYAGSANDARDQSRERRNFMARQVQASVLQPISFADSSRNPSGSLHPEPIAGPFGARLLREGPEPLADSLR